jgi:hypothetical protein
MPRKSIFLRLSFLGTLIRAQLIDFSINFLLTIKIVI